MNDFYEGKSISQWVELLQAGSVPERCAAALALSDIGLKAPDVGAALQRALTHPDPPVQAAARIALGLDPIAAENRRKMFDGLMGTDDYERHTILQSLEWLITPEAVLESAPHLDAELTEAAGGAVSRRRTADSPASLAPSKAEELDITLVPVAPWWLVLVAVAVFVVLAWLLRSIWWSKLVMAAIASAGVVFLWFVWMQREGGKLSSKRFNARIRLGTAALLAGGFSSAIGFLFPASVVVIDNANAFAVRLLINDQDWLNIGPGESKRRELGLGKHRVTVQSADGKAVLDAHDIDASDHGPFILNVLSGQVYFHGTAYYGDVRPTKFDVITEKWFRLPEVDCRFVDPPDKITVVVNANGVDKKMNKTFITKAVPPRFREPQKK